MTRIYTGILFVIVAWGLASCTQEKQTANEKDYSDIKTVDFNDHIKPILSDRCFACHGPDHNSRKAELRLDVGEGALQKKLESGGYAFVAGDTKASEAYQRMLSDDPETMMPPPSSHLSLSKAEKDLIAKWIRQGATWKEHWSFIPPERTAIPGHLLKEWVKNPIDEFVAEKLDQNGLKPSPEARKERLLRRATFDLTGLPPTAEEIEAFVEDHSVDAYEKVVDRLLSSPAYGERMASLWLDAARYSDSHGYQDDRPRTMWPWRDWVIQAYNENLPYDKFGTWQLAGDLLPDATYEQKLATGFNRNHGITQEGGVIEEEYLTEYAADRTQTFGTVFLGLTLQCARCHDHKYDPISQQEFYQLFSFFNNIPERGKISYFNQSPAPAIKVQNPVMDSTISQIKQQIAYWEQQEKQMMTGINHALGSEQKQQNPHTEEKYRRWLEQKGSIKDVAANIDEGLLVWVDFDQENSPFVSKVSLNSRGKVNINLPPEIEKPEINTGKSGNALAFNGKNFLSMGEIGDFDHYHQFSLGAWIQHSNQHDRHAGILSRRVGEQKRQGYDLVLTRDHKLTFRIFHDANSFFVSVQTRKRVPMNTWTHVFATYDGSGKAAGIQLYIDGEKQATFTIRDNLQHKSILNGNDFLIGNWNHRARVLGDLYGFKGGKIDEVKLYNRRLSPIEIPLVAGMRLTSRFPKDDPLISEDASYQHYLMHYDATYQYIRNRLDSLRALDQEVPYVMIMEELDTIKTTYWLNRGAYDAKMDPVERGTPQAILDFSGELPHNRLGLARWLFDERNPLTARVAVNRMWQMLFGKGLVSTPEDFGNQGALPTHPRLLDWLAVEFRTSGWDVKHMLRLMVTSATYRQSARINIKLNEIDPDNVLLARGPSKRLASEMMRDQALAMSGLLNPQVGGKWVKPYQPPGLWKEMANQIGENKYRPSQGADLYRRSIYSYWKRTIPPPTMLIFDTPERTMCEVNRQSTTTPLQALVRLNAPIYVETSRKLAEKLILEYEAPSTQISQAFLLATSRSVNDGELEMLKELYISEKSRFESNESEADALLSVGASPVITSLEKDQLAALTVVINTIMNLEEAKYRG